MMFEMATGQLPFVKPRPEALMYAIINAHFDTAAVLIEKGADLSVADSTGNTPLYAAVDMHTMGPMLSRPSQAGASLLTRSLLNPDSNPNRI